MNGTQTYIDKIAQEIWDLIYGLGPGGQSSYPFADKKYQALFRNYAVLCKATGTATTAEDVHDAWAAWQAGIKPDHRSLRPFAELSEAIQGMDEPYQEAIIRVAADLDDLLAITPRMPGV